MYFAILWKNPEISLHELQGIQAKILANPKKWILIFECDFPDQIAKLWWIIKAGKVIKEKDLQTILKDQKLIGIQEIAIWKHFKNTIWIKRFKTVKIQHTDKEIQNKWIEIVNLTRWDYGIVKFYQNIPLYESIDFDKPARSMTMWMMPAKLAHILINIGVNTVQNQKNICIYDPFCGTWTTNFLANFLWYDTIWSDLKINYAQENLERWRSSEFFNKNKNIDFFQHDITQKLSKSFEKNIIITEWRLGPIITQKSSPSEVKNAQKQIIKLYSDFFSNIIQSSQFSTIVCTIPRYTNHENPQEMIFKKAIESADYRRDSIKELYHRENQLVARKICIISKK